LRLAAALRRDRRRTTCPLDQGRCLRDRSCDNRPPVYSDTPAGLAAHVSDLGKLLFLHWPIAAECLRPLIPPRLCLDTFEGCARVSVTPFMMWGSRPAFLPRLPGLLSRRALLPLYDPSGPPLSCAHLPSSVVPPLRGAAVPHVDNAEIPGSAGATRGPAAARPGEAPPGGHLASRAALKDRAAARAGG